MKIALSKSFNPYKNLSTEEILLKDQSINEDLLFFYQNENAIIIGRNQNAHEEINDTFVRGNQIKIARRVSGGGAVYHDLGNINFSFITKKSNNNSYQKFLKPIISFLNTLNVKAEFQGRNDVVVEQKKISGNAQYFWKDKMFHHGTILFDANLSILSKALKPNLLKLKSKAIKSNYQRVSNINSFLEKQLDTPSFYENLVNYLQKYFKAEEFDLTNYKIHEIKNLENIRKSHDWIYLKNPHFNFQNKKYFVNRGTISLEIETEKNKIKEFCVFGDFLSKVSTENFCEKFIGMDFDLVEIKKIIQNTNDFENYFGLITKEQFFSLFTKGT